MTGKSPIRAKLSDKIYGEIIQFIADSDLDVGDKIQTEAYYCNLFSVSRTVVREALSRLKIDGIIESQQGRGSVLLQRPNRDVFRYAEMSSLADMQTFFEFRQLIEGEAAALAAIRHTKDDLSRIEDTFLGINTALDSQSKGVDEDLAFHLAVATAAHNKFLLSAIKDTKQDFLKGMFFARELTTRNVAQRGVTMQREHRDIISAIRERNSDLARNAMIEHLKRTRDRVFLGTSM